MEAARFLFAAQRLLRTLRAAAYPLVKVIGELDDNGNFEAVRMEVNGQVSKDWNPDLPNANIVVVLDNQNRVAQAVWENGTVSGEIDDEGILRALEWDWDWDDLEKLVSTTRWAPGGQRIDEGKQMPLPFPEGDIRDYLGDVAALFRIPPASAADFGHGLRQWLQGMAKQIGKIVEIEPDKHFVKCHHCDTVMFKDDAHEVDGEYYCDDCSPEQCESCGTWMDRDESNYDEGSGETLCSDCYSERQSGGVEDAWASFNHEHPELKGALEKADAQDEMDIGTYVTIFEDLAWNTSYGGMAWAGIAKTWRDMEELVSKLQGGGGKNDDWVRLTATVDHAFDLVHNTGSLFTKAKAETKKWLFQALEDKYFLDPLQYRNKLSADGRKLLDSHIRQSGGVREWKKGIEDQEKVMGRVERSLHDYDFKMAERLFRTYKLDARDFYNRDSFLTIAFWQQSGMGTIIPEEAGKIREFIRQPSEDGAIKIMEISDARVFKQGTDHRAAPILRGQVLPKLLSYAKKDGKVREWLAVSNNSYDYLKIAWRELFQRERKDAAEARTVASALGAAAAMIRIALKQSDFYDFYASTVVDPDKLPDDLAQYARGFKRVLTIQMAKDLLVILRSAVIREARHVSDSEAIESDY